LGFGHSTLAQEDGVPDKTEKIAAGRICGERLDGAHAGCGARRAHASGRRARRRGGAHGLRDASGVCSATRADGAEATRRRLLRL